MYHLQIKINEKFVLSYNLGIHNYDDKNPLDLYFTNRIAAINALKVAYENLCKTIKPYDSDLLPVVEKPDLIKLINEIKEFNPYLNLLIRKMQTFHVKFSKKELCLDINLIKLSPVRFTTQDKKMYEAYNCRNDINASSFYCNSKYNNEKSFTEIKELADIK